MANSPGLPNLVLLDAHFYALSHSVLLDAWVEVIGMKKVWITLSLLIFAFLPGCRSETQPNVTPTVPTLASPPLTADPTSLITLLRNPVFFEGRYIQLSGSYKPLPLPVCTGEGRFSPATWTLTDGEIDIPASGFDGVLRPIADPGLPLVVEGRWLYWEGPVGCDRRAPTQQLWYLEVTNIVSPNPLTIAQIESGETVPIPVEDETPAGDQIPLEPTSSGPSIPTASPTILPTMTASPVPQATATQSIIVTIPPVSTPTASITASPRTAAGTGTSTSTPTPTATADGTTTVTATSTPDSTRLIDYAVVEKGSLAAGGAESWNFDGESGDLISISVAPVSSLDISVDLVSPDGATIVSRNQGINGQIENINQQSLTMSGTFKIIVRSTGNSVGDYALVINTDGSQPFFVFRGNIAYGEIKNGTALADVDDLWNFQGTAGDVVTIQVSATGNKDLILYLQDPDSVEVDFADGSTSSAPPDDEEIISQYTLSQSGLYTIGVGEVDFEAFGYSLTLSKDS